MEEAVRADLMRSGLSLDFLGFSFGWSDLDAFIKHSLPAGSAVSKALAKLLPPSNEPPDSSQLDGQTTFRFAVLDELHLIRWLLCGSPEEQKPVLLLAQSNTGASTKRRGPQKTAAQVKAEMAEAWEKARATKQKRTERP